MKDKELSWWKESRYILLAFIIPVLILMLAYLAMWITPFGELSLIVSDMSAQYIDMFSAYRDVIHGNRSLFYSWSQIQGSNMFVLMTSYILSPFNIIAAILPEDHLADAITIITLIKVGFAGASCSWYLKKAYNNNDISIVVFACCYALMGYNIIFALNILWLDIVILLPFVIWGVDLIIKDTKKHLFFTISLILIFCINYYLSYMIGIFCFIYFIYKYLCIYEEGNIKLFLKKLIVFLRSAIIAALCSACVLLPHYYSLGLEARAGFLESEELKIAQEYDFLTIFTKLFIGSYDTIAYEGIPNLYCGLIITILLLFYFMNEKIRFREKILSFFTLIFLWFSCVVSFLYLGWHLFAYPHFFEGRFSFIICFFMISIGYVSYTKIEDISIKSINKIFLAIAAVIILIDRMNYSYITDTVVIYTLTFLILYYLFFVIMQKVEKAKRYYKLIFVTLICAELCLNTNTTIMNMDSMLNYPSKYDYYEARDKLEKDINKIMTNDNSFYRIDKNFERSENDGINIGYPCVGMFTSIYNQYTKDQINYLGIKVGHNWIKYPGFTPITDAFFNIKYVILENTEMPFYELVSKSQERTIYKNPYALSVGYMVAGDLNNNYNKEESKVENPFLCQNQLLSRMLGENDGNYFKPISIKKTHLENMASIEKEIKDPNSSDPLNAETLDITQYYKKDSFQKGYIEYEVEAHKGPLYLYLPTKIVAPMHIQIQERESQVYFDYKANHIVYLGEYEEGERVKVKLIHGGEDIYLQDSLFYYLDMSLFQEAVETLSNHVIKVEEYSDQSIKGTITVDDRHVLFTSIPYDEGWHIKVDGKEYKITKVMNGFIGLELPNSGIFHLEFNYIPQGLKLGCIISIVGILLLIITSILTKITNKANEAKECLSNDNE